jgi:hypothetical protein
MMIFSEDVKRLILRLSSDNLGLSVSSLFRWEEVIGKWGVVFGLRKPTAD